MTLTDAIAKALPCLYFNEHLPMPPELSACTCARCDLRPAILALVEAECERVRVETLDECVAIAHSLYDVTYWDDPSAGIAARIRALKEPTP